MLHQKSLLPLAVFAAQLCSAIPVAPQQAILALKSGTDKVNNLINDVTNSNLPNAQIDYHNVQSGLDDMGFYLGQLTDSTCISSASTDDTTVAATSQSAVLAALGSIETHLTSLSSSVSAGDKAAAITAYQAAQSALESTYSFVFGASVSTSSGSDTSSSSNSTSSQSVFTYIQSAQTALNSLAFDVLRSDYATAKQDYQTVSSQLNNQIAPVAQCSFSGGSQSTCASTLTCIQSAQAALNRVAGDLLASASTTDDCLAAGADLAVAYGYISQA